MAEGRVQHSAGTTADWLKYNPDLRYGELVIERKENGEAAFHTNVSPDGMPHPYSESLTIWDSEVARQSVCAAGNASTSASIAQSSAIQAAASAKEVANIVEQLNEKKILLTLTDLRLSLNVADGGLDIDVLNNKQTMEGG